MKDAISSEPGKPVLPAVPKSLSAWAASPAGQWLHHLPRARRRSGRLCARTHACGSPCAYARVHMQHRCARASTAHSTGRSGLSPSALSLQLSGGRRKVHRWPTALVGSLRGTVPIEKGKDPRTHPFSWASDWAVSPEEELALAWTQQCCLRAPPVLRAALGCGG